MNSHRTATADPQAVRLAAHQLAIYFTEDSNLPARHQRNASGKKTRSKTKQDSQIENRFQENLATWEMTLHNMLNHLEHSIAWRLINIQPNAEQVVLSANADFNAIIDYLIKRKQSNDREAAEIGNLAMLSVAIQKTILRNAAGDE